jgi:hypothetical protein
VEVGGVGRAFVSDLGRDKPAATRADRDRRFRGSCSHGAQCTGKSTFAERKSFAPEGVSYRCQHKYRLKGDQIRRALGLAREFRGGIRGEAWQRE